jgi:hypothetical protein
MNKKYEYNIKCDHRVKTYRAVTDSCKHCGSLRFHVPTFSQATGQKWSTQQVPRAVKANRHPIRCIHLVTCRACAQKKMGTLVRTLYMYLLCDATHCEDEDMRITKQYETDVINANITLMQIIACAKNKDMRITNQCKTARDGNITVMRIYGKPWLS